MSVDFLILSKENLGSEISEEKSKMVRSLISERSICLRAVFDLEAARAEKGGFENLREVFIF